MGYRVGIRFKNRETHTSSQVFDTEGAAEEAAREAYRNPEIALVWIASETGEYRHDVDRHGLA